MLKLQKDSADTAASYTIDVLDAEQVDSTFTMPANYVSVTSYGVTPSNGADDTTALNNALSALSGTGKGLWLPAGTYLISERLNLSNVALRGAGEWATTIQSTAVNGAGGLFSNGGAVQITDLAMVGDQTSRNNDSGAAGIEGSFAPDSLIFNVLIEHEKVGLWINPGTGLYIAGLRVRDVFADGVHLHGGTAGTRVDQTSVRNTGDDQFALDSEGGVVTNSTIAYNTSQSPIQAGGIGVYGGANNSVLNNAVSDTVAFGAGIKLGTDFGPGFHAADLSQRQHRNEQLLPGAAAQLRQTDQQPDADERHLRRGRDVRHRHLPRHRQYDRHGRHRQRRRVRRAEQPGELHDQPGARRQRILKSYQLFARRGPEPAADYCDGLTGAVGSTGRIRNGTFASVVDWALH